MYSQLQLITYKKAKLTLLNFEYYGSCVHKTQEILVKTTKLLQNCAKSVVHSSIHDDFSIFLGSPKIRECIKSASN